MNNIVAIVGRPNVNQPFNRLIQKKARIQFRSYQIETMVKASRKRVFCIDTGGYVRGSDVLKEKSVNK
jgi:predicted GTPase